MTAADRPVLAEKGSVPIRDEWPCPACGAAIGEACRVPIPGVDTTGWNHDARILAPVYADLADAHAEFAVRPLPPAGGAS